MKYFVLCFQVLAFAIFFSFTNQTTLASTDVAGMIDYVDGKTYHISAGSNVCAIHLEKVSDIAIATTNVISKSMREFRNKNICSTSSNVKHCKGLSFVRSCDNDGFCEGLQLLPDGNIVSSVNMGDRWGTRQNLKFYPSSSNLYWWCN